MLAVEEARTGSFLNRAGRERNLIHAKNGVLPGREHGRVE